jgi:hypothetical protein
LYTFSGSCPTCSAISDTAAQTGANPIADDTVTRLPDGDGTEVSASVNHDAGVANPDVWARDSFRSRRP